MPGPKTTGLEGSRRGTVGAQKRGNQCCTRGPASGPDGEGCNVPSWTWGHVWSLSLSQRNLPVPKALVGGPVNLETTEGEPPCGLTHA